MLKCDLLLLVALFFCIFAFMEIYVEGYYDDYGKWHKGYVLSLGYEIDYDHIFDVYSDSFELAWDFVKCEIIGECRRRGINETDTDKILDVYNEELRYMFNQKNQ